MARSKSSMPATPTVARTALESRGSSGPIAASSTRRFHAAALDLKLDGPDGEGRHSVELAFAGANGCIYKYDEETMARLLPLLERVQAATDGG